MVLNMTTLTHVNLDVSLRDEILTKITIHLILNLLATLETKRVKVLSQIDIFVNYLPTPGPLSCWPNQWYKFHFNCWSFLISNTFCVRNNWL